MVQVWKTVKTRRRLCTQRFTFGLRRFSTAHMVKGQRSDARDALVRNLTSDALVCRVNSPLVFLVPSCKTDCTPRPVLWDRSVHILKLSYCRMTELRLSE